MARRKKTDRQEILRKKRLAEKKRRDNIKSNPELHKQYLDKEKARYLSRKESKKLVPIAELTPRRQRVQRTKWKINQRNSRTKRKQLELIQEKDTPPESGSEDIPEQNENIEIPPQYCKDAISTKIQTRACINTTLEEPSPGPSTRTKTPLKTKEKTIARKQESPASRRIRYRMIKRFKEFQDRLTNAQKQNATLRKRLIRMKKNVKNLSCSPKTKAELMIADPSKKEDVKKALIFKDIIQKNMNEDYENQCKSEKINLKENVEPVREKLKKYNLLQELPKITRKTNTKEKENIRKKQIDDDIRSFYEDDDNSRMTSGKKECITFKKQNMQKRFLKNSLLNLHKKFLEKYGYDISYTYFCKARPFWITSPIEKNRDTCLCKIHENIDLIVKALNKNNIILEKSSEDLLMASVCSTYNLQCLERNCGVCTNRGPTVMEFDDSTDIKYCMWGSGVKEVSTKNGIRVIKITEKKELSGKPKQVLLTLFRLLPQFYIHNANIVNQYECTKKLKKEPENNSVVVHMDFSENYSTKYSTEVQSLHFGGSRSQISLHTSVIYISGISQPISFCTYSDCVRHDAAAVWAHIIPITDYIEKKAPETNCLHFVTDSTCSQYRNKTINYMITKLHWYLPNLRTITWNYSEAGHGKGAPDGVGATLKRTADQIVRYGKDIPDVKTFAEEMEKAVKNVILAYVSEYNIIEKEYLMPIKLLKPFKGTMQVHQIVWDKNNIDTLALRRQSCISRQCKNHAIACPHGKHLGFYSNPMEDTNPTPSNKINIISNVSLIPSKDEQPILNFRNESQQDMLQNMDNCREVGKDFPNSQLPSHLSSDVIPLYRCDAFLARSEAELPRELQAPLSSFIDDRQNPTIHQSSSCLSPNVVPLYKSNTFVARSKAELPKELQAPLSSLIDDREDPTIHQSSSCLSPNVVPLYKSNAFIARSKAELPRELQSITPVNSYIEDGEEPRITKSPSCWSPDAVPLPRFHEFLGQSEKELLTDSLVMTPINSKFENKINSTVQPLVSCLPTDISPSQSNQGLNIVLRDITPLNKNVEDGESTIIQGVKEGAWIITSYQYKLKKVIGTKYFIGKVMNINHEDNTLTVKSLRKVKNTKNTFTWPSNDDVDCVPKNAVLKLLTEPNINRRDQLIFNDVENITLE